jgi:hypothetical protein
LESIIKSFNEIDKVILFFRGGINVDEIYSNPSLTSNNPESENMIRYYWRVLSNESEISENIRQKVISLLSSEINIRKLQS